MIARIVALASLAFALLHHQAALAQAPPDQLGEPMPAGTVLLVENFDDPASGVLAARASDESLYRVGYEAGEYSVQRINPNAPGSTTVTLPGSFTDVTIAVDVRIVGDPAQRVAALECRRRGGVNEEQYRGEIRTDRRQARLLRYQDGVRTVLTDWTSVPGMRGANETNRLELSCVGPRLTLNVNGSQAMSLDDAALQSGALAISAGTLENALLTEARFDNLLVTAE